MTAIHTHTSLNITRRLRRLRRTPAMRALVRETRLSPEMFVLPLFVRDGEGIRREVPSMPGVFNLSVDEAVKEARAAKADGVSSVMLFGIPEQNHAVHAVGFGGLHFFHRLVDRQVEHAGHRRDFTANALAFADKQREDEHVGRQPRLAHERAHRRAAAQPPQPAGERQGGVRMNLGHDGFFF